MPYLLVKTPYVWVKVDTTARIAYPVIAVGALTLAGEMARAVGIMGLVYVGTYALLVAVISNRVCIVAGIIAAALSALCHEYFFMNNLHYLDVPSLDQGIGYMALFGVAWAVGRKEPKPMPPPDQAATNRHQMPFEETKKGADGKALRSFWSVEASGNWKDDADVGKAYAAVYIERIQSTTPGPLFSFVLRDMIRTGRYSGVEAAFGAAIEKELRTARQNKANDPKPY